MFKRAYYELAGRAWAETTRRRPFGRSIYDDEWDICIVLDSARYDSLCKLLPETGLDYDIGREWSRGSITTEWLSQTFRPPYKDDIADTTMVTANPHSETVFGRGKWLTNHADVSGGYPPNPAVNRDAFANVYELWRNHATHHGAVPPDVMRDATVQAYRTHGSKVVAHWLQPHEPYLAPEAEYLGGGPNTENVWRGLTRGELSPEQVWQSYEATLSWTLAYVTEVLQAVDADVLITSDHGNAMGEWGVYGHPFGWLQPAVRRVPWIRTRARAETAFEPNPVFESTETNDCVDERLKALGYR